MSHLFAFRISLCSGRRQPPDDPSVRDHVRCTCAQSHAAVHAGAYPATKKLMRRYAEAGCVLFAQQLSEKCTRPRFLLWRDFVLPHLNHNSGQPALTDGRTMLLLRGVAFALGGLLLAGCMQTGGTLAPASDANFTARDRQQLANPPYQRVAISPSYQRQIVQFHRREAPGSVVVETSGPFVYYVMPGGKAIRYGAIVGEAGQAWSGVATVGRKEEWPGWTPTADEKRRLGPLPNYVEGGARNPMGARGLYLYAGGKDTLYRIHGTNQPEYIGHAISSGCIRMTNEDVIDLYNRVRLGATVVVL
jgi:lipoprotein-anchoring transpeptidase ErfK/SrfK